MRIIVAYHFKIYEWLQNLINWQFPRNKQAAESKLSTTEVNAIYICNSWMDKRVVQCRKVVQIMLITKGESISCRRNVDNIYAKLHNLIILLGRKWVLY